MGMYTATDNDVDAICDEQTDENTTKVPEKREDVRRRSTEQALHILQKILALPK